MARLFVDKLSRSQCSPAKGKGSLSYLSGGPVCFSSTGVRGMQSKQAIRVQQPVLHMRATIDNLVEETGRRHAPAAGVTLQARNWVLFLHKGGGPRWFLL